MLAEARRTRNVLPIGQEMCMCAQMNQPQPTLVEDDGDDDAVIKQLKQLIKNMTTYDPKKRHSMRIVEKEMARIFGASSSPIPTPPHASSPGLSPPPAPSLFLLLQLLPLL